MDVVAVTKYKHGMLSRFCSTLGWTQLDLARECGVSSSKIGPLFNLKSHPSEALADTIQSVFAKHGLFFDVLKAWPTGHSDRRRTKGVSICDISVLELEGVFARMGLPMPGLTGTRMEVHATLMKQLKTLTEREQQVIEYRFFDGMSLREAGKLMGCTRERIRQIEAKAFRKLRTPARIRKLECFLEIR